MAEQAEVVAEIVPGDDGPVVRKYQTRPRTRSDEVAFYACEEYDDWIEVLRICGEEVVV